MKLRKLMACLFVTFVTVLSFCLPLSALESDHTAVSPNPFFPNLEENLTNEGMEGYARYKVTNIDDQEAYSDKVKGSRPDSAAPYDRITKIPNWGSILYLENTKSIEVEGQLVNTNSTSKKMNVTLSLPRTYEMYSKTGDIHVDASKVTDPSTMVKSSNPNTKLKISFEYSKDDSSIAGIKTVRINGEFAPQETIMINIPVTTPKPGYSNSLTLYLGWPSRGVNLYAVQKSTDIAKLNGAMIYAAISDQNNGSGEYTVFDELNDVMPRFSEDLIVASHTRNLYVNNQNADLSIPSDSALYKNSTFLLKTEPIFNAIKDYGFTTYADTTRGFWNSYAYNMNLGTTLINKGGELYLGDSTTGADRHFYVEVHKILDTKDLTLVVGDTWNHYDNLTYHQNIKAHGASSTTEIPTDQIRVENNVDTSKAGVYSVKYLYDIAEGRTVTKTAKVTVIPKKETINAIPKITADDQTLTEGDSFDPLKGVTAGDTEDGDITGSIEILENNVPVNEEGQLTAAGTYSVTYTVKDSQGASAVKTIQVTVKEKTKEQPEKEEEDDHSTENGSSKTTTKENTESSKQNRGTRTSTGTYAIVYGLISAGALLGIIAMVLRYKRSR